MPQVILTRGYPASGKSTWARTWVAQSPATRVRVSRDDIRAMLTGTNATLLSQELENLVTNAVRSTTIAALKSGLDVVVDATHLRRRHCTTLALNVAAEVPDVWFAEKRFFGVPFNECVRRDALREHPVGHDVLHKLTRYGTPAPVDFVEELAMAQQKAAVMRYAPSVERPDAWIFDIDGTLADKHPDRDIYDMSRVGDDTVNETVARVCRELSRTARIIITSGRTDSTARAATIEWLNRHEIPFTDLFMREATGPDYRVKHDILHQRIAPHYSVLGVFDDRNSVVDMWRAVGLQCFQVAPGDF